METCSKRFLASVRRLLAAKDWTPVSDDIMTTSLCLIDAVSPGPRPPLRPGAQKPQRLRHTCAAAGPPLATLSGLGLRRELRFCSAWMYMRACVRV